MSKKDLLIELLKKSVDKCYADDKTLIDRSMERTSVARIFYYMQNLIVRSKNFECFREYNLDCEYNRNMEDGKRLADNERGKIPDVILHKRGSNDSNLLILEFKSAENDDYTDDYDKLQKFTKQDGTYNYFLGVFVKLNKNTAQYTYFQNGQERAEEDLENE